VRGQQLLFLLVSNHDALLVGRLRVKIVSEENRLDLRRWGLCQRLWWLNVHQELAYRFLLFLLGFHGDFGKRFRVRASKLKL
jgi:hypothetical protein